MDRRMDGQTDGQAENNRAPPTFVGGAQQSSANIRWRGPNIKNFEGDKIILNGHMINRILHL